MERHAEKQLLVLLLSLLLVFTLVSSVPMPRSLRLASQQQQPPALKLSTSSDQDMAIDLGKPTARMDFEIDDYPPPGHNHHHGPGAQPSPWAKPADMPLIEELEALNVAGPNN